MNARLLIFRGLCHYWRTGVVVAFGVAVATAALTGSLLVGASVSGTLRERALARLGGTTHALVAPRYFRQAVVEGLARDAAVQGQVQTWAPLILATGVAQHADTGATAPRVNVLGVEASFWKLFSGAPPAALTGRQSAVNASLARDLGLKIGDAVLLNLERQGLAAGGTLFAQQKFEKTVRTLRVEIAAILPDTSAGAFSLTGGAEAPRSVFVALDWLAPITNQDGRVNALALQAAPGTPGAEGLAAALNAALQSACALEDLGLKLVPNPAQGYVSLQSPEVVLNPIEIHAGYQAAKECGARAAGTSVYLADSLRVAEPGKPESAYALVAGVEPLVKFIFRSGGAEELDPQGVWLNEWLKQDLGAQVGSRVTLAFPVPAWDGVYRTREVELTVRGIVALEGPAKDPALTPNIEGVTEAKRIDEWSTPFPIVKNRIKKPRDEDYWKQYSTTPKAFVHLDLVKAMWAAGSAGQDADWVTSLRVQPPAGEDLTAFTARLGPALRGALTPAGAGLAFRAVAQEATAAAAGNTDFGQLFLGLSFFIVAAAAGLAAMLMRLMAERRAAEAGLMLACGFRPRAVLAVLLGEGLGLSVLGVLVGVPCGLLYAWGLVKGLNTFWSGAVAGTGLRLHPNPQSLWIGGVSGLLVGLLSVAWGARTLKKRLLLELLAGWRAQGTRQPTDEGGRVKVLLIGLLALAGLLVALSAGWHVVSSATAFFAGGGVLLLAGLCASYLVLVRAWSVRGLPSLPRLALRSAASYRSRSLLAIGLLASASFVLVAVAAQHRDLSRLDVTRKDSGAGGFALRATSALPVRYDFGTAHGRAQLGFEPAEEELFRDVEVVPFLVSRGDDISCLNLARPAQPRVLGVSARMQERRGFAPGNSPVNFAWELLAMPEVQGVIPVMGDAASVQWTLHSGRNQVYPLAVGSRTVPVRFVAVLQGSLFASEILMGEGNFRRTFPGVDAPRYFLISVPPGREEQVAQVLRKRLGPLGLEVRGTREVLAAFLAVQNTYLSVFSALGGLGLLLGTVGLLAVLLRSAFERRAEFALLLATGFRSGALSWLMVLEHAGLLLAGLAVGTACALLAVAPALAARESALNAPILVGVLAGIFVFGLVACALAARAAIRGPLLEALRGE